MAGLGAKKRYKLNKAARQKAAKKAAKELPEGYTPLVIPQIVEVNHLFFLDRGKVSTDFSLSRTIY